MKWVWCFRVLPRRRSIRVRQAVSEGGCFCAIQCVFISVFRAKISRCKCVQGYNKVWHFVFSEKVFRSAHSAFSALTTDSITIILFITNLLRGPNINLRSITENPPHPHSVFILEILPYLELFRHNLLYLCFPHPLPYFVSVEDV